MGPVRICGRRTERKLTWPETHGAKQWSMAWQPSYARKARDGSRRSSVRSVVRKRNRAYTGKYNGLWLTLPLPKSIPTSLKYSQNYASENRFFILPHSAQRSPISNLQWLRTIGKSAPQAVATAANLSYGI